MDLLQKSIVVGRAQDDKYTVNMKLSKVIFLAHLNFMFLTVQIIKSKEGGK